MKEYLGKRNYLKKSILESNDHQGASAANHIEYKSASLMEN